MADEPIDVILPDDDASSDPALIEVVCRELKLGPRMKLLVRRTMTAISAAFKHASFPESLANINRILACGGFDSRSSPYRAFNGRSLEPPAAGEPSGGPPAPKRRKPTISLEDAEAVHEGLLLRALAGDARFVELAVGRTGANRTLKCAVDKPPHGLLPIEIADLSRDPLATLDRAIVKLLHYAGPDVSFVSRNDDDAGELLQSSMLGHQVHWTGRINPTFKPEGADWVVPTNDGVISIGDAVASAAQYRSDMPAIVRLADGREVMAAMPRGSTHCYVSCGPGERRPRYDRMKQDIAFLERPGRPLDDFPVEWFRVVAEGHEAQYTVFTRMILLACHLGVWHACATGIAPDEAQHTETELDTNEEGQ